MNSIVDFTLAEKIEDMPQSECIRVGISVQVSSDDAEDDAVPAIYAQNWGVVVSYRDLTDNTSLLTKLEEVFEPQRNKFFKRGLDRLEQAILDFFAKKDLRHYADRAFPVLVSTTRH